MTTNAVDFSNLLWNDWFLWVTCSTHSPPVARSYLRSFGGGGKWVNVDVSSPPVGSTTKLFEFHSSKFIENFVLLPLFWHFYFVFSPLSTVNRTVLRARDRQFWVIQEYCTPAGWDSTSRFAYTPVPSICRTLPLRLHVFVTLDVLRSRLHAPRSTLTSSRSTFYAHVFTLDVLRSHLHARRSMLTSSHSTFHAHVFMLDVLRSRLHARRSTLTSSRSTFYAHIFTLDVLRSHLHARRSMLTSSRSTFYAHVFTLDAQRSRLHARRSTLTSSSPWESANSVGRQIARGTSTSTKICRTIQQGRRIQSCPTDEF